MNILYRIIFNFLKKKADAEAAAFRNARYAERARLNGNYNVK